MIEKYYIKQDIDSNEYYFKITFYQISPILNVITKKYYVKGMASQKGLVFNDVSIKNYYSFMQLLFPNCSIINNQHCSGDENGSPDFKVVADKEFFYLELKFNNDTISIEQLKWYCNHKKENIYVINIKPILDNDNYTDSRNLNRPKAVLVGG